MSSDLLGYPAVWGAMGAFLVASAQIGKCIIGCRANGGALWFCGFEFAMSLASGAVAATVFSTIAMTWLHLTEPMAVSAMVGLFSYRMAPILVDRVSEHMAKLLTAKIDKLPGGDE